MDEREDKVIPGAHKNQQLRRGQGGGQEVDLPHRITDAPAVHTTPEDVSGREEIRTRGAQVLEKIGGDQSSYSMSDDGQKLSYAPGKQQRESTSMATGNDSTKQPEGKAPATLAKEATVMADPKRDPVSKQTVGEITDSSEGSKKGLGSTARAGNEVSATRSSSSVISDGSAPQEAKTASQGTASGLGETQMNQQKSQQKEIAAAEERFKNAIGTGTGSDQKSRGNEVAAEYKGSAESSKTSSDPNKAHTGSSQTPGSNEAKASSYSDETKARQSQDGGRLNDGTSQVVSATKREPNESPSPVSKGQENVRTGASGVITSRTSGGDDGATAGKDVQSGDSGVKAGQERATGDAGSRTGKEVQTGDSGSRTGKEVQTSDAGSRTGKEVQTGDSGSRTGREVQTSDSGSRTGKEVQIGDSGSRTGREVQTSDSGSRTGKEVQIGDSGSRTGREVQTSDSGSRTGREVQTGDSGGRTSKEIQTGDSGSRTGKEVQTGDSGSRTGKEIQTGDSGGRTSREIQTGDSGGRTSKEIQTGEPGGRSGRDGYGMIAEPGPGSRAPDLGTTPGDRAHGNPSIGTASDAIAGSGSKHMDGADSKHAESDSSKHVDGVTSKHGDGANSIGSNHADGTTSRRGDGVGSKPGDGIKFDPRTEYSEPKASHEVKSDSQEEGGKVIQPGGRGQPSGAPGAAISDTKRGAASQRAEAVADSIIDMIESKQPRKSVDGRAQGTTQKVDGVAGSTEGKWSNDAKSSAPGKSATTAESPSIDIGAASKEGARYTGTVSAGTQPLSNSPATGTKPIGNNPAQSDSSSSGGPRQATQKDTPSIKSSIEQAQAKLDEARAKLFEMIKAKTRQISKSPSEKSTTQGINESGMPKGAKSRTKVRDGDRQPAPPRRQVARLQEENDAFNGKMPEIKLTYGQTPVRSSQKASQHDEPQVGNTSSDAQPRAEITTSGTYRVQQGQSSQRLQSFSSSWQHRALASQASSRSDSSRAIKGSGQHADQSRPTSDHPPISEQSITDLEESRTNESLMQAADQVNPDTVLSALRENAGSAFDGTKTAGSGLDGRESTTSELAGAKRSAIEPPATMNKQDQNARAAYMVREGETPE